MPKPRTPRPTSPHAPAKVALDDYARDAAFRAVARQARIAPQFDIEAMTRRAGTTPDDTGHRLGDLDAAFAHAIYHQVVRRWLTLSWALGREVTQGFSKLEPRVQSALLCGAAQILYMDRVPAHAAIDHAVEWAKLMVRPGAGGLVNAVLRRVARLLPDPESNHADRHRPRYTSLRDELPLDDGRALVLREPILPEDDLDRLAIATSHPRDLLDHWSRSQAPAVVAARAMHDLVPPPTILNAVYAGVSTRNRLCVMDRASVSEHRTPGFFCWHGSHAALVELLQDCPDVWVQDPSSAAAILSIADLTPPPARIIDYCAGQGTKTRQLAFQFPDAEIVATDADEGRYATLRAALDGFRVEGRKGRVCVQPISTLRTTGELGRFGFADLILLDVPCSNTGVLARRPEARYRYSGRSQNAITSVQRQIIADCLPLLADRGEHRGMILYATCSLESAENTAQAAWAGKWHGFQPQRQRSAEPRGLPGEEPGAYLDGAYSVLLTR
ncbi:MAG: transcription antitermination factor NusB [Phycisphaerales bacterium]